MNPNTLTRPRSTASTPAPLSRNESKRRNPRCWAPLNRTLTRAALFSAAFVASASVIVAVGAAFDRVSRQPWLRDTPMARAEMASCSVQAGRTQRDDCQRRVVAAAQARDAGARQFAAAASAVRAR